MDLEKEHLLYSVVTHVMNEFIFSNLYRHDVVLVQTLRNSAHLFFFHIKIFLEL